MSEEIKRLKRDICLIKYRNLPLIEYEKESDSDIYYYPNADYLYWIKLEEDSSKELIREFIKLLKLLGFGSFIFFVATNKPWISKKTQKRKDFDPLTKAIKYFESLKIDNKFNGGIEIGFQKLKEFLPNFYTMTECDGGFFDVYFSNIKQDIIFYLHYSGEIKILPLNEKNNTKFLKAVKQTRFIDSLRDKTDRI
ncbi:MAG: hypothetical protein J0G96_02605 [Flavobacteriia bacterium]|nr:hypothetical protein [Flavobacteriia bacterium]OJX37539.1 MAG: hypothetical protein BGO87_00835 [Flavobacteriia bacterium 40-80]